MEDRDRARQARDANPSDVTREQYRKCRNVVKSAQYTASSQFFQATFKSGRQATWPNVRRYFMTGRKSVQASATPTMTRES